MNGQFGMRIPMVSVAGFNSIFSKEDLLKTKVTGPGSRSDKTSSVMVTFPHLENIRFIYQMTKMINYKFPRFYIYCNASWQGQFMYIAHLAPHIFNT